MITLVTGGSGSGKSEYAEQLALDSGRPVRFYLATMIPCGEEGEAKVQRHQRQRQGKGFLTVEQPQQVRKAAGKLRAENAVLLLECVSNLAANEMFLPGRAKSPGTLEELADQLAGDIAFLSGCVSELIIVTNEVASDGICYEPETMDYIRLMGLVNSRLSGLADRVVEVVCGIPLVIADKKEKAKKREKEKKGKEEGRKP